MTNTLKMAALTAAMLGAFAATHASALDWTETVDIKKHGIDVKEVDVRANQSGYTVTTTTSRDFNLHLYARAKSGKRIAIAEIGAYHAVSILEGHPASQTEWEHTVPFATIGSGTKRTINFARTYNIPLNKVAWSGNVNPVVACNRLLQQKMQQGYSKQQVLSQVWKISADAQFSIDTRVAKPKVAQSYNFNDNFPHSNYHDEGDVYLYRVPVRCLPAPNSNNQVQQPQQQPQPSAGNQRQPGTGEKILTNILKNTTISVGVGLGRSSGGNKSTLVPGVPGR